MSALGHLIVVEGPDGVGKSTLVAALVNRLRDTGVDYHTYAFPGNEPSTLGSLVYRLHHEPQALGVVGLAPVALQTMHIAAHLDAIERVIRPRVRAGENIVLDRYWWSTWVYGTVSGIPRTTLDALIAVERTCWGTLQPLVVFLIDRPRPWCESADMPTWQLLAGGYREIANREQARCRVVVISSDAGPERIATEMASAVASALSISIGSQLGTPQARGDQ